MGSRLRHFRVLKVAAALAVMAGAAVLVSSALGSAFPGVNGKLAYVVYAGDGTPGYIVTANTDGTGATQISKPGKKTGGDFQPRFSADGTKVVFTRNASNVGYDKLQIWIADANGKNEHRVKITGLPKGDFPDAPTFTPDGKSIVFSLDTINAPAGLAEVSVHGGKMKQLTTGDDYQPTVSPDGTKIAFMRGFTLVVANIDGSNPQILYTEPQSASSMDEPDFSPDGSTIAFMELDSSTLVWDIFTIAADGRDNGTATNLTNGTTTSSMDPAYSPDGTKIAFTSEDNTTFASSIDVMDAAGGNATTAISSPQNGFVAEPDWGVPATPPAHHKHHHKKHHHKKHK
jgi:Tol biopolymer transport system component